MGSCNRMLSLSTSAVLLVLSFFTVLAKSQFIEYKAGNSGIIIAVPHGGLLDTKMIPNRRYGTFEPDDYTKELGEFVRASICRYLGKCPHLVVSNLKRIKLDPNRDIAEGAQGNSNAEKAWRNYHGLIDYAKKNHPYGVVIDLHGQSHRMNSTELGYLLSTNQLNRGIYNSDLSSIQRLARRTRRSGREIITGSASLGAFLEQEGYKAFPSPRQLAPGSQAYFPGYYTVRRHGADDFGTFDAISVETPREVRIDAGRTARLKLGDSLGRAISNFYKSNYE